MAIDPNIALGVKPIELANPLAQYGMLAQIQNAQNQNALAQYQIESAKRTDAAQNALGEAYKQSFNAETGQVDRNLLFKNLSQGGAAHLIPDVQAKLLKTEVDQAALKKTGLETEAKQFELANSKLKHGWQSMGEAATPQAAIQKLNDGVQKGYFDMKTATAEVAKLQNMTPDQYRQYRIEKVMGLLDAKDQLAAMSPKIERQDIGGQIVNIQSNPLMPGYGLPVQGMAPIAKTETFADKTAKRQADIAAGRLGVEQQRLAQEATGVVYQDDGKGNIVALPSKLKAGEVPVARTAVAPGPGFQPLKAKPSEAEGKEIMSINQQRAIVKGAIDAVTATPDAFGMVRGMTPESLGGRLASPEENQARSYLFNVVSGVIKERAGTAQSAGEAATLARFLPSETDNAEMIKSKLEGFDKYLVDKEAGTSKQRGGVKPPLSSVDQQALQWANSNPADPRAAAIKQRLGM